MSYLKNVISGFTGFMAVLTFQAEYINASEIPLLSEKVIASLDNELSGEAAKRNLEFLSRQHRMRVSEGMTASVDHIYKMLEEYGFQTRKIYEYPADGKTMFGTQKSRKAWDVKFGELWEIKNGVKNQLIASWDTQPLRIAQDSESGDVEAELINIGSGVNESDYKGKNVRGKLVLTSSQPSAVVALAIEKYGAVGILSYAQNQKTAWWGEDGNLIRWGHLETFSETKSFGFMLTPNEARAFEDRLEKGENITLSAKVIAGQKEGLYKIPTATILGRDTSLKSEEISMTCHLDHPRPGANDNASGCVAILEVARTLKKLIRDGKIERPLRTIRFIWPSEIEGSEIFLSQNPEITKNIKASIHMDMVGGGPNTKAIFHVTPGPKSLPSFIHDVSRSFGEFVNKQSDDFASGKDVNYPVVSKEGGREALLAQFPAHSMGSDHQVFQDSSFSIPTVYLNDWPDRYIHTNYDLPANIDPTKLKRSAFIGAATAYYLANLTEGDVDSLQTEMERKALIRVQSIMGKSGDLEKNKYQNLLDTHFSFEKGVFNSLSEFVDVTESSQFRFDTFLNNLWKVTGQKNELGEFKNNAGGGVIYERNPSIKGPMGVFGYNYFSDHYMGSTPAITQSPYGGEFSWEALNFVDGKRGIKDIRNALSAELGEVPLSVVEEYFKALETINIIRRAN